jgi:hypothetical protein
MGLHIHQDFATDNNDQDTYMLQHARPWLSWPLALKLHPRMVFFSTRLLASYQ